MHAKSFPEDSPEEARRAIDAAMRRSKARMSTFRAGRTSAVAAAPSMSLQILRVSDNARASEL